MVERTSPPAEDHTVVGSEQRGTGAERARWIQTWVIVVAVLITGMGAAFVPGIMEQKRAYDRIYPGCWQLIGRDEQCEMRVNVNAFIRGA